MDAGQTFAVVEENGAIRCANPRCGRILTSDMKFCPHCADPKAVARSTEPATKACPYCGEMILAVAVRCRHCRADLDLGRRPMGSGSVREDGYSVALLGVPVAGLILVWTWVGSMNLLQSPGGVLGLLGAVVVIATALIAAAEAAQLGMRSDRQAGTYSPTAWFFIVAGMWAIGYPAYLHKRARFGQRNYALVGACVALLFLGSVVAMGALVDERVGEVRGALHAADEDAAVFRRQADAVRSQAALAIVRSAIDLYRLETGNYPTTEEGLAVLSSRKPQAQHWSGPYLDADTARAAEMMRYWIDDTGPHVELIQGRQ